MTRIYMLLLIVAIAIAGTAFIYGVTKASAANQNQANKAIVDRLPAKIDYAKATSLKAERAPSRNGYEEFFPGGMALESDSWDSLSQRERLLALGFEVAREDGTSYKTPYTVRPVHTLAAMLEKYYLMYDKLPGSIDDLFECYYHCVKDAYDKQGIGKEEVKEIFLSSITSPVTGKPLEWNHPDFSKGNTYITLINENPNALTRAMEEWQEIWENKPEAPEGYDWKEDSEAKFTFVYCRIYGETGVIDNFKTSSRWTSDQLAKLPKPDSQT